MAFRTRDDGLDASVARLTELAETLDVRDHSHVHAVLAELRRVRPPRPDDPEVQRAERGLWILAATGVSAERNVGIMIRELERLRRIERAARAASAAWASPLVVAVEDSGAGLTDALGDLTDAVEAGR